MRMIALAVLLIAPQTFAIELSLEENRAERGSVGFIDIQRLFVASPDAQRAKENFEELVRQAEEHVNSRRAEIVAMHRKLDDFRSQRDVLAKAVAAVPPPTPAAAPAAPAPAAPATTISASSPTVKNPAAGISTSTSVVALSSAPAQLPPPMMAISTSPAALPGMQPHFPASSSSSTTPAPTPSGPSDSQKILDLDGQIVALQADIVRDEADLAHEHDEADRGLLDAEGRRTDQVLARLYRAISAVARQEGVSVVVEKANVLYGHPAVDLTDKVIKYLRTSQQAAAAPPSL